VLGIDGIVLRYGAFYGPDTSLDRDGVQTEAVRKRQFPLVGEGGGAWSFIHVDDAATATLAAIEHGRPGIYNVVDDDPAPVRSGCHTSPRSQARSRLVAFRRDSPSASSASTASR
jgi:nucleoside-diphosphate-sugar epimerase